MQELIVGVIVGAAVFAVLRRAWLALAAARRPKSAGGCGDGCGCAPAPSNTRAHAD